MALLVYNLLLLLCAPLLVAYLLWRLAKGKEDRARWGERWGRFPESVAADNGVPRFWVHAVSVGEVMAAAPVLRALRQRFPDAFVLLSTITPSGREVALKQVPPADTVVYFPLDFPFAAGRALAAARPDVILLMEWEIWPNFLQMAWRRGARIAVLNGRISDRGLRRGRRAGFFTRPGLDAVNVFAMQSGEDARRAALVGVAPNKIATLGNTKFDESMTPLTPAERTALRADLDIPPGVPIWVCGSTRPGEEAILADAYRRVALRFPDLRLIVAPRHLERTDEVEATLRASGLDVARRSQQKDGALSPGSTGLIPGIASLATPFPAGKGDRGMGRDAGKGRVPAGYPRPALGEGPGVRAAGTNSKILLLDTFGELGRVYAVADVAFVGGSLLSFGGQSVFQPLAQGVPAVFGPHMNNQRDIAALAKTEGVGFEVRDADTLATEIERLLSLPELEKKALAERARALIERNQGVAERCVNMVAELLERCA